MAETLTMMAVHAHPDDEASSTGGVLARYSAQGVRTVVVTCTNGEFGDASGGVKPGQNGHDEREVARQRLAELRESCTILSVTNLELLLSTDIRAAVPHARFGLPEAHRSIYPRPAIIFSCLATRR